jgi:hypothetical protein
MDGGRGGHWLWGSDETRGRISAAGKILTLKTFFMSPFLEQKDLFDKVLRLNEEERRNPMIVIERFFGDYRLHECRYNLWMMVETCLTTDNAEFSDPDERADLLLRFRDLEGLLEAGYLLQLRHIAVRKADRGEMRDVQDVSGEEKVPE